MEWMMLPYKRYFDFSGRSRRKEYWMFVLLFIIVYAIALGLMFSQIPMSEAAALAMQGVGAPFYIGAAILGIFALVSFVPAIAVQVRRFHDQDKSGWFVLLNFVPYVGGIIVLVFMFIEGTKGPNRFGADPKNPTSADVFA